MVFCHSMYAGSVVGIHEVMRILKSYLMQKNLFERVVLIGGREAKTISHLVEFPVSNFSVHTYLWNIWSCCYKNRPRQFFFFAASQSKTTYDVKYLCF